VASLANPFPPKLREKHIRKLNAIFGMMQATKAYYFFGDFFSALGKAALILQVKVLSWKASQATT
jgi:hypothetical protein